LVNQALSGIGRGRLLLAAKQRFSTETAEPCPRVAPGETNPDQDAVDLSNPDQGRFNRFSSDDGHSEAPSIQEIQFKTCLIQPR
jgi:hypothetical protein